jgi:hypothetical protein
MARRRSAAAALALVAVLALAGAAAAQQQQMQAQQQPTVVRKVVRRTVPAGTALPAGYRPIQGQAATAQQPAQRYVPAGGRVATAPLTASMAEPQTQPQFAVAAPRAAPAAAAPVAAAAAAPVAAAAAAPAAPRYSFQNMLKVNAGANGGNLLSNVASLAKTGINPNGPLNVEDLIKLGMAFPKLGNGTASLGDQLGAVAVANKVRKLLPKSGSTLDADYVAGVLDSITRDASGKLDVTKLAKLAQTWAAALVPFAEQFAKDMQANANGVIASMLTSGSQMVDVGKISSALGVKAEGQQELLTALAPLLDKSSSGELYGLLQKLAKPGMEALQKTGAAPGDADVAALMSTAMGALGRGVQKMG